MNFDAGTILVIRSADDSVAESGLSAAALSETDDVAHEIDEFFGLTDDNDNDDENETDDDNDDDGEDDGDDIEVTAFETTDDSASLDDMDTTDATGSGSGSNDDDSDSGLSGSNSGSDSGEVD